jgi:hypothetical protein
MPTSIGDKHSSTPPKAREEVTKRATKRTAPDARPHELGNRARENLLQPYSTAPPFYLPAGLAKRRERGDAS